MSFCCTRNRMLHAALAVAILITAVPPLLAAGSTNLVQPLKPGIYAPTHSFGFFAGIGQFESASGLGNLLYAPDDAVALAHLFVEELKLLPPSQTCLALSGPPSSARGQQQLAHLRRQGIQEIKAERKDILRTTKSVIEKASGTNGLLVLAFSTHGYQQGNAVYLMPSDGEHGDLPGTAVPFETIKNALDTGTRVGKRILIVDACRETKDSASKGGAVLPSEFLKAFEDARGCAVIFSCSPGQRSWEDREEGNQGVFTRFFIEAFQGAVRGDENGYIRLGKAVEYATRNTEDWVLRKQRTQQTPRVLDCDASWHDIPMAVDPERTEAAVKRDSQRKEAIGWINQVRMKNPERLTGRTLDEVESALKSETGDRLTSLLEQCKRVYGVNDPPSVDAFVAWFTQFAAKRPADIVVKPVPENPPALTNTPGPPDVAGKGTPPSGPSVLKIKLQLRSTALSSSNAQKLSAELLQAVNAAALYRGVPLTGREQHSTSMKLISEYDRLLVVAVTRWTVDKEYDLAVERRTAATPYKPTCKIELNWQLLDPRGKILVQNTVAEKFMGEEVIPQKWRKDKPTEEVFEPVMRLVVTRMMSQLKALPRSAK
jgi:hypothetical protein